MNNSKFMLKIDHKSKEPFHQQLFNQIRDQIISGEREDGDKLPSENEMKNNLNISRSTIRQALQNAESEGLIQRIPGKGSFVNFNKAEEPQHIGFILSHFQDESQRKMLLGAEQVIREKGFRLVFATSGKSAERENIIEQFCNDGIKGFILWPGYFTENSPSYYQALQQKSIPFVLMDRSLPDIQSDLVTCENYNGGYIATEHLILLKHRKIAYAARPILDLKPIHDRYMGYCDAMKQYNLDITDPILIGKKGCELTLNDIYTKSSEMNNEINQIIRILKNPKRPTAIFAMNDLMAFRIMLVAQDMGLKIPEELSIIGFDGSELSNLTPVPLTSIKQDSISIGRKAASILINRMKGYKSSIITEEIPVTIDLKKSTAAKTE